MNVKTGKVLKDAIKNQGVKTRIRDFKINQKHKVELRNAYLRRGVPWIYEENYLDNLKEINEFKKRPKNDGILDNKLMKLAKVKELVKNKDKLYYDYRKEKINARKYGGFDKVASEFFPSWYSDTRTNQNSMMNKFRK